MAGVEEALLAKTPIGADLAEGLRAISLDQKVTFTRYVRKVLPLDGYIFWISSDITSEGAFANVARGNAVQPNQPPATPPEDNTLDAQCSLHVASDSRQEETTTNTINRVLFTSLQFIQGMNDISPDVMYIADAHIEGLPRFAFSSRASFYKQSGLWHYVGNAVYPTMETQLIDNLRGFNGKDLIVSNSLPAWLSLNGYNPPWPVPLPMPAVTLYPSFLVPQNLKPPYGAVHIGPDDTQSLQAAPAFDATLGQQGLASDRVTLTLYGVNNAVAMTMLSAIMQYAYDNATFGITNLPVVLDDKVTQNELGIIAQKKRIRFDVSYNQGTMRNVARQLILAAVPSFHFYGDDNQTIIST